jgi:uncharacterized protein (DUF362 family)
VVPPAMIDDFRRVQADEERHRRIFEALAEALDEQDRLVASETAASLARKIAVVGDVFLPPAHRGSNAENPIASGGPVWVLRGASSNEKLPLFRRLLAEAGLAHRVADRSRVLNKPPGELRVAIKAAFMLGYHRKDLAPITDPALLDELARCLRELGCRDVALVEARNLYDRFYENRTVPAVAAYLGLDSPHYRVVDLSEEQVPHAYGRGMAQYSVGQTWREADFRITFGKLRSHPVDLLYLCVGNVEGVGARCDEFLFAERQAHRHTAIMMALDEFPPHFALLDAYDHAADGLVGMMGCPRPPAPRRLYAGADALAVDLVAARHTGLRDPRKSAMLRTAFYWFGDPIERTEVIGVDEPIAGWRDPYCNEWSTLLSFLSYPVYELGSGRGALFVPEMDVEAFPSIGGESRRLRLSRNALRALIGLRH